MEYVEYIPKGNKMIFRNIEFTFKGYEQIDDESLFLILSSQFIKFYWSDVTINDISFTNMIEFTSFLDTIL